MAFLAKRVRSDQVEAGGLILTASLMQPGPLYTQGRLLSIFGRLGNLNGAGTISGVLSIAGVPAAGSASLIRETDGFVMATRAITSSGVYLFQNVPIGKYAISLIDTEGNYRGKVVHVEVT